MQNASPTSPAHGGHEPVYRDPVCGMLVDPAKGKPKLEHDGHVFHFCCQGCHDKFVADPGQYLTAKDPVCGMEVNRATARHFLRHEGAKVYFCSQRCHDRFEADPDAFADGVAKPVAMPAGTKYTCPMDPEVISDKPDICPKCGMALEPMGIPPADAGPNPELVDFTRRFRVSIICAIPLVILSMGPMFGLPFRQWLGEQSEAFRAGITHVVIDPSAAYAAAVTTEVLPNAELVVDHFHLVKLANDALTAVRRRVTFDAHGRRGRKQDPEWANRRRLLTARERLSPRGFASMWNALIDNDPSCQILSAYIAKEELRQLLAAARDRADDAEIRTRLYRFYSWCADTHIPELHRLATTIETWWPAILAFLHTGLTNARTEGFNRLVKQVKRVACGFRNTENSRRRIRFHCTRAQRATTRFTTEHLPG